MSDSMFGRILHEEPKAVPCWKKSMVQRGRCTRWLHDDHCKCRRRDDASRMGATAGRTTTDRDEEVALPCIFQRYSVWKHYIYCLKRFWKQLWQVSARRTAIILKKRYEYCMSDTLVRRYGMRHKWFNGSDEAFADLTDVYGSWQFYDIIMPIFCE